MLTRLFAHLGNAKVAESNVTISHDENIGSLEIAVEDLTRVNVAECRPELQKVPPNSRLREALAPAPTVLDQAREIAAAAALHDDVERPWLYERIVVLDNVLVLQGCQQMYLPDGILLLILGHAADVALLDYVGPVVGDAHHLEGGSERPLAQLAAPHEVARARARWHGGHPDAARALICSGAAPRRHSGGGCFGLSASELSHVLS